MDYHIFKKPKTKDGKKTFDWYYWFWDESHCIQIQRRCKGCFSKRAAEDYVAQLPPLIYDRSRVGDYADTIFCDDSDYLNRCKQFGKVFDKITLDSKRITARKIKDAFGRLPFSLLTEKYVGDYLLSVKDSASGKNLFISVLKEIFRAAQWDGIVREIPSFKLFAYHSHRADILNGEEIKKLFNPAIWKKECARMSYLLALAAGLRSGEAFAVQKNQFFFDKGAVLVNGFLKRNKSIKTTYNKTGSEENRKWRISMIDPAFLPELKAFVEAGNFDDEDFVFGENKCPPDYCAYKFMFNQTLKKSGIDTTERRIRPHSLRYTYVTRMRNAFDADFVRKLVGHSDVKMTEYYTRNELENNLEAVAAAQEKFADFYYKNGK